MVESMNRRGQAIIVQHAQTSIDNQVVVCNFTLNLLIASVTDSWRWV